MKYPGVHLNCSANFSVFTLKLVYRNQKETYPGGGLLSWNCSTEEEYIEDDAKEVFLKARYPSRT